MLELQSNKYFKRRVAMAQRNMKITFLKNENKISASQRLSVQLNKWFKRIINI